MTVVLMIAIKLPIMIAITMTINFCCLRDNKTRVYFDSNGQSCYTFKTSKYSI